MILTTCCNHTAKPYAGDTQFSQILTTPGVQRRLKVGWLEVGLDGPDSHPQVGEHHFTAPAQVGLTWTIRHVWYFRTFAARLQWVTANENERAEKWLKAVSSSNNNAYKNGMDHFSMHCVNWHTLTRNTDAFYKILSAPLLQHISRTEDAVYEFTLTKLSSCWSENTEEF